MSEEFYDYDQFIAKLQTCKIEWRPDTRFVCTGCGKAFSGNLGRTRHQNRCTATAVVKCCFDWCTNPIGRSQTLVKIHMMFNHGIANHSELTTILASPPFAGIADIQPFTSRDTSPCIDDNSGDVVVEPSTLIGNHEGAIHELEDVENVSEDSDDSFDQYDPYESYDSENENDVIRMSEPNAETLPPNRSFLTEAISRRAQRMLHVAKSIAHAVVLKLKDNIAMTVAPEVESLRNSLRYCRMYVTKPNVSKADVNSFLAEETAHNTPKFSDFESGASLRKQPILNKAIREIKRAVKDENDSTRVSFPIALGDIGNLRKSPGYPDSWRTEVRDPVALCAMEIATMDPRKVSTLLLHGEQLVENGIRVFGDINTGDRWIEVERNVRQKHGDDVHLLPLIFESDETSVSEANQVSAWPLRVVPGIFPLKMRRNAMHKLLVTLFDMPGNTRKQGTETPTTAMFHQVWRKLSELIGIHQRQILEITLPGEIRPRKFFPVVHMIISDNEEFNKYCLVKQNYSRGAVCRRCHATRVEMKCIHFDPSTIKTRIASEEELHREKLKDESVSIENWVSKCSKSFTYPISSGFPTRKEAGVDGNHVWEMGWYCDDPAVGVLGVCPVELLHTWVLGVVKTMLKQFAVLIQFDSNTKGSGYTLLNKMLGRMRVRTGILPEGGGGEGRDWASLLLTFGLALRLSGLPQKKASIRAADKAPHWNMCFKYIGEVLYLLQLVHSILKLEKVTTTERDMLRIYFLSIDTKMDLLFQVLNTHKLYKPKAKKHKKQEGKKKRKTGPDDSVPVVTEQIIGYKETVIGKKLKFHELNHVLECITEFGSPGSFEGSSLEYSHSNLKQSMRAGLKRSDLRTDGTRTFGKMALASCRESLREIVNAIDRNVQHSVVSCPDINNTNLGNSVARVTRVLKIRSSHSNRVILSLLAPKRRGKPARKSWKNYVPASEHLGSLRIAQLQRMFGEATGLHGVDLGLSHTAKSGQGKMLNCQQSDFVLGDRGTGSMDRVNSSCLVVSRMMEYKQKSAQGLLQTRCARFFAFVRNCAEPCKELILVVKAKQAVQTPDQFSPLPFVRCTWRYGNDQNVAFELLDPSKLQALEKVYAVYDVDYETDTRKRDTKHFWYLQSKFNFPVDRPY